MIIYTFLVNETAAVFQLLHISMCNLKYVIPLSGAVLITRWLLRMTVVHVGLPQHNMDQTQFLPKTTSPAIGDKKHDVKKQQQNHLRSKDLCPQRGEETIPEPT